jgi:hypothetical protein
MSQNITLKLAVLPYCNHPKFEKDCIYCKDAQKVYNKIKQIQEQTKSNTTKVQVLEGTGGNK